MKLNHHKTMIIRLDRHADEEDDPPARMVQYVESLTPP